MIMTVGRFKDKELRFIPSWYLKFLVKNWNDKGIRDAASCILETRSRLGIEKPKKQAKKLPLETVTVEKPSKIVDYQVQNANLAGKDAF